MEQKEDKASQDQNSKSKKGIQIEISSFILFYIDCYTNFIFICRYYREQQKEKKGRLAQLVERTLSMREVEGSKPSLSKTKTK